MSETASGAPAVVRNPGRTDTATAEMDTWVLDVLGLDMNAWPPPAHAASPLPAAGAAPAGSGRHGTAYQVVAGLATGAYHGGRSLLGGLADLARLAEPFTAQGMIAQLVDSHAPTRRLATA